MMQLILSPSKTLDFETPSRISEFTQPEFLEETKTLARTAKKLSPDDLIDLMGISQKLADLNYQRFQNFKTPLTTKNSRQAILAFKGDVYDGLAADDFTKADYNFAQKHLRILSGFYGLLKPLDLIQPYRLEMGIALKNPKGKNLYEFWGNKLTRALGDELIINLASIEYSSVLKLKNHITIHFKEMKNGKPVVVALFAKKARGMMARYAIKNKITNAEKLKNFSEAKYKFSKQLSNAENFVFVR